MDPTGRSLRCSVTCRREHESRPTVRPWGGDKNYDMRDHLKALRQIGVTPHVAQNKSNRRSAIDDRTTSHAGYEISQRKRKCVEQVFGWGRATGPTRKAKYRGWRRVGWMFTFTQTAYNLVRMRLLLCPT